MDGLSEPEERTWDLQQRVRVIAGKEVDDDQWRVIRFLREYYAYHGRAPMNRDLKAGLGMSLMDLEALFPGGIRKGARRIAGLPNPRSCT